MNGRGGRLQTAMSEVGREPLDAVYTWVDGADPAWRARKRDALARIGARAARLDASATSDVRFASRDELRYSLRSIERFAPFFRKVHLVTDRQVPRWLDVHHPQLQLVFHDALFPDPSHLPTFSSQAIESHLHRIPGLTERFVYFNDDVLLDAPVTERDFFDEAGRCVVYLDRRRVVWDPAERGYDVGVNAAARNSSRLIEELGGPRIEHRVDHTPYALRRSLLAELWERFPKELDAVSAHPFRDPSTVQLTSCLAQHYGILTHRAVAVAERRLAYFKVKKRRRSPYVLAAALAWHAFVRRGAMPFLSINDAGELDDSRITAACIARFLESAHPHPSRFEKQSRASAGEGSPRS